MRTTSNKTFIFTKRQKESYTPTHPMVNRSLTKTLTIPTSSAAAAASADDECRNFGTFFAKERHEIILPLVRNKLRYEIRHNIFAADLWLYDVSYPVSTPSPASHVSSPTIPSSAAGSEGVILSGLMCPEIVSTEVQLILIEYIPLC